MSLVLQGVSRAINRVAPTSEIISEITAIEPIALGPSSIRGRVRWRKQYGPSRWRKLKGVAMIRLRNGRMRKLTPLVRGPRDR
jgi:hypothetical protein